MPKKLSIAYTTCFLDVSGVTKINFDILHRLKEKGNEVHIIATEASGTWDYIFEININKPFYLHTINKKDRMERFIDYLKENKVDIIFNTHSLWVYENLPCIKQSLPDLKVVDSLHVLEPYCFRGGYPDISANKYVHPFIDRSILISENLREYLPANYRVDADKLSVIRNGIDTKRYMKSRSNNNGFREEIGLDKGRKLIGFIGRLSEQKRPVMFLEIARQISLQYDSCAFYMIGSGHLGNRVKKFIKKHDLSRKVFNFTHRHDIENVLASTDLLLVPSLYEGAPLTILEAVSAGVRVIASDVGAIKEYVENYCTLIPVTSEKEEINAFVKNSIKLLEHEHNTDPAVRFVKQNYDISKTSEEYEAVFYNTVDN
ncbi:MAG: glycosyltransferase family 4 protein [Deltaproteobacteria bacterium]